MMTSCKRGGKSGGEDEVKPWTPHWVFHGSGVIHDERTGCIACPCDCPGGIIADNRTPIYRPMPTVRFDWSKAPPVGTTVYVRIRPVSNRSCRPPAVRELGRKKQTIKLRRATKGVVA